MKALKHLYTIMRYLTELGENWFGCLSTLCPSNLSIPFPPLPPLRLGFIYLCVFCVFLFHSAYVLYYREHGGVDLMGLKSNP